MSKTQLESLWKNTQVVNDETRIARARELFGSQDWFGPLPLMKAGICDDLVAGQKFIIRLSKQPDLAEVQGLETEEPEARFLPKKKGFPLPFVRSRPALSKEPAALPVAIGPPTSKASLPQPKPKPVPRLASKPKAVTQPEPKVLPAVKKELSREERLYLIRLMGNAEWVAWGQLSHRRLEFKNIDALSNFMDTEARKGEYLRCVKRRAQITYFWIKQPPLFPHLRKQFESGA